MDFKKNERFFVGVKSIFFDSLYSHLDDFVIMLTHNCDHQSKKK